MAETSKNKIYYNDNENSVADVLTDMKKMAESTDKAIENSKYNDAQIKKDISDAKKEQALKDAEQDNKIIELQNEKTELEKELKEAQEDFYQNSIRGQASGEYIHVEDSSNCRARIGIVGNHEQETRSGKNKIEITKTTTTVNGCTHTIKDGTDTLSGTSSTNWANLIIYSFVGDGKTYTLSGSPSTSKNIFISAHDNVQKKDLATSKNGSTGTFVATSGNSIDIIICVAPNLTLANELFKPQLEEGLKATGYEQGGAMPSLNYPSEIKTVGDNVNLFPGWENGTIDSTSREKKADPWYIRCKDFIPIVYGVFYTISQINSVNFNDMNCAIRLYDKDKKYLGSQYVGNFFKQSLTFTVNNLNVKYIIPVVSNGRTVPQNAKTDIKLEKGKVATPYSKYGQGCVKVTKCNNNLFNKNDIVNKAYINSSGEIVSNDGQNYTNYISVVSNAMYTIHAENPLGAVTAICFYDTNKKFLSGSTYNNVKSMSFKTPSNCDFVRASVSNINLETLQIEEGPATTYEEHEEQSYIMPVQKEMLQGDYFDFDNEKEEHKWIKLIFDGTENWLQSGNTYPTFYISPYEIASKFGIPAGLKAFCNYFSQKSNVWGIDEIGFDTANLRQDHVDFRFCLGSSSTITTLEAWKKKLVEMHNSGKPLALYFQILNLNELDFTDEQKAVAKELNNARTYKNVTNITTDSKAILSLDYAKDLETQNQKMQNEIDEIKQLLSTTQTSALLLDNMQTDIESEVE